MPGIRQQSQVLVGELGSKALSNRVRKQKDAVADGADRQAAIVFAELAVVVGIEGRHVAQRLLRERLDDVIGRKLDHIRVSRARLMTLPRAASAREVLGILVQQTARGELGPGVAAGNPEPPGEAVVPIPRPVVRCELFGARAPAVPNAPVVEIRTIYPVELDLQRLTFGDDGPGFVRKEPATAELLEKRENSHLHPEIGVTDDVQAVRGAVQDEGFRTLALQICQARRVGKFCRRAHADRAFPLNRFGPDRRTTTAHVLDELGELCRVRSGGFGRRRRDQNTRRSRVGSGKCEGL